MDKLQLWRHRESGERFIVEIGGDGEPVVKSAAGPLHHSEIAAALKGGFDNDPGLAEDIDGAQDSYDFAG